MQGFTGSGSTAADDTHLGINTSDFTEDEDGLIHAFKWGLSDRDTSTQAAAGTRSGSSGSDAAQAGSAGDAGGVDAKHSGAQNLQDTDKQSIQAMLEGGHSGGGGHTQEVRRWLGWGLVLPPWRITFL